MRHHTTNHSLILITSNLFLLSIFYGFMIGGIGGLTITFVFFWLDGMFIPNGMFSGLLVFCFSTPFLFLAGGVIGGGFGIFTFPLNAIAIVFVTLKFSKDGVFRGDKPLNYHLKLHLVIACSVVLINIATWNIILYLLLSSTAPNELILLSDIEIVIGSILISTHYIKWFFNYLAQIP